MRGQGATVGRKYIDGYDNKTIAREVRDLVERIIDSSLDGVMASIEGNDAVVLKKYRDVLADARKVQEIARLMAEGEHEAAMDIVMDTNPFIKPQEDIAHGHKRTGS